MRLTIIPSDGTIGIDNYFFNNLNLNSCNIPSNVHALQWYGAEGELEFVDNADRTKPMNEFIDVLPQWANECVDLWNLTKLQEDARIIKESNKIPTSEIL